MMWVWVVLGVLAALEAGVVAELEQEKRRGDRYEPRHLSGAELGALAGRNWYGRRLLPPAPGVHHERDFYGSMTLAGEREFYEDDEDPAVIWAAFDRAEHFLTAPPADPVPCEDDRDGDQTAAWFHGLGEDPGPGVDRPPPPGPVQDSESDWMAPPVAKPWPEETGASGGRGCALTGVRAPATAPEPTRLASAADVDAARPWLDVQLEDLYVWVREVLAA